MSTASARTGRSRQSLFISGETRVKTTAIFCFQMAFFDILSFLKRTNIYFKSLFLVLERTRLISFSVVGLFVFRRRKHANTGYLSICHRSKRIELTFPRYFDRSDWIKENVPGGRLFGAEHYLKFMEMIMKEQGLTPESKRNISRTQI